MSSHTAVPAWTPLSDAEVDTLGSSRVVVRDQAFGEDWARRAHEVLSTWFAEGRLDPAGIGRTRQASALRTDQTTWVEPDDPALAGIASLFEGMRLGLMDDLRMSLQRYALQAACYPPGAHYAAHVDAFHGDTTRRRVTAVWYLNPDWTEADGGALRCHYPDGPVDLVPVMDRLVLFLSDAVEHEVRPANRHRYALTAWFRGPEAIPFLPDPSTV